MSWAAGRSCHGLPVEAVMGGRRCNSMPAGAMVMGCQRWHCGDCNILDCRRESADFVFSPSIIFLLGKIYNKIFCLGGPARIDIFLEGDTDSHSPRSGKIFMGVPAFFHLAGQEHGVSAFYCLAVRLL